MKPRLLPSPPDLIDVIPGPFLDRGTESRRGERVSGHRLSPEYIEDAPLSLERRDNIGKGFKPARLIANLLFLLP
jgi:hypothetical protein